MSRAAQEVARQVRELRKHTPQKPRRARMDGPDDEMGLDDAEGIEDALRETDAATPPPPTEGDTTVPTAKKKTAAKPRTRKPAAPKKPKAKKAQKAPKPKFETVPDEADLRLASNGVRKSDKNRYVNIEFTDGFSVRLFPLGFKPADVQKVTDLIVAVLNR